MADNQCEPTSDVHHSSSVQSSVLSTPASHANAISNLNLKVVNHGSAPYMIRCNREAVAANSLGLAKLIRDGLNRGYEQGNIEVLVYNVDKYDFELVVRFLETRSIQCRDHLHWLNVLDLANHFQCPSLTIHCVRELDMLLASSTVIDVFHSIWFYQNQMPREMSAKSKCQLSEIASPSTSKDIFNISLNSISVKDTAIAEKFCVALLNNVLQLIDMQAEVILPKKEMTQLRFEELAMIVLRDALQISSELVLFNCLADWSFAECDRKKILPSVENKRRVLGALCYAPRYLLLPPTGFHQAMSRVELLDPAEIALIKDALNRKRVNFPSEQSELLTKFRTPRPNFPKMPIRLSKRSHPRNYSAPMRRADQGNVSCFKRAGRSLWTVCMGCFD